MKTAYYDSKNLGVLSRRMVKHSGELKDLFFASYESAAADNRKYSKRMYSKPEFFRSRFMKSAHFTLPVFDLYWKEHFVKGEFPEYLAKAEEIWGWESIFSNLMSFTYFAANREVLKTPNTVMNWLRTEGMTWFIRSFFWTVWQGKQKEEVFLEAIQAYLKEGYELKKVPQSWDTRFMIDFIVSKDKQIIMGVSLKGKTYQQAQTFYSSDWLELKEVAEKKGRARFELSYGAPVVVAITDIEDLELVRKEAKKVALAAEKL